MLKTQITGLITGIACLWAAQAWGLIVPMQTVAQEAALGPYRTNWTTNALLADSAQTVGGAMEFASFDSGLGELLGVRIDVTGSFTATLRLMTQGGQGAQHQGRAEVGMLIDVFNDGSAERNLVMGDTIYAMSVVAMQDIALEGTINGSLMIDSNLAAFTSDAGASFSIGCASTSLQFGALTQDSSAAVLTHKASSTCGAKVVFEYRTGGTATSPAAGDSGRLPGGRNPAAAAPVTSGDGLLPVAGALTAGPRSGGDAAVSSASLTPGSLSALTPVSLPMVSDSAPAPGGQNPSAATAPATLFSAVPDPLPLPGTLLQMLAGLVVFGLHRRGRRKPG